MAVLRISQLSVSYGDLRVLRDVSLEIEKGELVCVVGANGAGKTTLMRAISGLVMPIRGEIRFGERRIDRLPPHEIAALGIVHVPEGRRLFPIMTVLDNLLVGSWVPRARRRRAENLERVFAILPRLAERKHQVARTLSGGEQQMLAIGRALMAEPQLLLLDEPSLGLSPLMVSTIFGLIKRINREQGTTVLLVEQNVRQALGLSDRTYVLENGRVVLEGTGEALLGDPRIKKAYLGL